MKDTAIRLIKEIESFGYEAYIVGGFVRDQYFSHPATDIDIVTNLPLDVLSIYAVGDLSKNKRGFEVIIVEYEGCKFEVASFRGDSIYDDLKRRDFNINSLAMCSDGVLIVPDDFDSSILKIGGAGEELFEEDPLRVLRGVRMAIKYDLDIEEETFLLMKKYAPHISKIDTHRVYEEFMKGLSLNKWRSYLDLCYKVGIPFISEEIPRGVSSIEDIHSRFLYVILHQDKELLEKYLRIPNEMMELHRFYLKCWEMSFYKPCEDYDLYEYLSRNEDYYKHSVPIYKDCGFHNIVNVCDAVIYAGNLNKELFVAGKDVCEILNIPSSPRVGWLIKEANRIIMKSSSYVNKIELLHTLKHFV